MLNSEPAPQCQILTCRWSGQLAGFSARIRHTSNNCPSRAFVLLKIQCARRLKTQKAITEGFGSFVCHMTRGREP